MAGTKDKFELTDMQEKFVEAFIGECEFDPIAAYKAAGYSKTYNAYSAAMRVLDSEAVKRAIHKHLHESTFWINEGLVIQRLWHEAMNANTDSARINALVWIGKHLGMWQEKQKEESTGVNIQILNYTDDEKTKIKYIESVPGVEENKDKVSLPEGVQVLSYEQEKPH